MLVRASSGGGGSSTFNTKTQAVSSTSWAEVVETKNAMYALIETGYSGNSALVYGYVLDGVSQTPIYNFGSRGYIAYSGGKIYAKKDSNAPYAMTVYVFYEEV